MNSARPIVQRNPALAVTARMRRGSWYAIAAAIVLNAALLTIVFMVLDQEHQYGPFVERFAFWFALPCAVGSAAIALMACWRRSRGVSILGIAYHGAALLVSLLWTFGWSFMGLWAQSEKGYLVGLILQVGLGQALVIVVQGAVYIFSLVAMQKAQPADVTEAR